MDRPSGDTYGIVMAVTAFSLFAVMPAYVQLLQPMSGYVVAAQRVLWSSLLMLGGLAITGRLHKAVSPITSVRSWPGLIFGSLLIGAQWWIFVWAPMMGRTLELSLGYFLLPLVMVAVGRVFFGERLRPLQYLAVLFACVGVVAAYLRAGGISWVVMLVAFGYPVYFILRRRQPLAPLTAFFLENTLLLPLATWVILRFGQVAHPFGYPFDWLMRFAGLAVLGTVPMICMLTASRRLTFSLFGLLNYLEPALIFLVALLLLGERVSPDEVITYTAIICALGLLALDGLFHLK